MYPYFIILHILLYIFLLLRITVTIFTQAFVLQNIKSLIIIIMCFRLIYLDLILAVGITCREIVWPSCYFSYTTKTSSTDHVLLHKSESYNFAQVNTRHTWPQI